MKSTSSHNKKATDAELLSASERVLLQEEIQQLKQQVAWFKNQLFGQKSEKRPVDNPHQQSLLGEPTESEPANHDTTQITYQRGKAKKQRPENCATDAGLRFTDDVPVEIIEVIPAQLQGDEAENFEIIDTKISHKLAQRPASYVVLEYQIPILKRKGQQADQKNAPALLTPIMPGQVLDNSIADVSVLVGLLVDKFLYHLPLHRQHQRMSQAGITVARATLTNWARRSIELLRPIVEAQLLNVLQSSVLVMDETPIKAGKKHKGKMQQAYFWPVYGEDYEVVFTYSNSRGRQHIEDVIKQQFQGTLVTDGYAAYARYAQQTQGVTHAQCWVHSRRKFIEAENADPAVCSDAIDLISQLYQVEKYLQDNQLTGDKKHQYRLHHSKPLVDEFFNWCQQQCQRHDLTPKHPLTKAINYVRNRELELRVF